MGTGVDVTDTKAVFETMVPLVTSPVDYVINNAGYFWEEHETLENINFDEQLKQIDICGLGPLRVSAALQKANLISGGFCAVAFHAEPGGWRLRPPHEPRGVQHGRRAPRARAQGGGRPSAHPPPRL